MTAGSVTRAARAASQLGSQHVELAAWRGWVEAVLDQPAGRLQASQRPPRADHLEVDVGAVAGDDVAKVLLVSERQDGEVVQGIALARLGPVDHAGDLVTVGEYVGDLQVAVDEHRCPRPERSLGNPAVARDQAGGKDVVRNKPLAFVVELRCDLVRALTGPWRQRRVVQHPGGGTRRGPRRRRRGRRFAEAAQCRPGESGEREYRRLPPQDLRSRDRRHGHRLDLDIGARLIGVDLQEHVADAQGRALGVGDDDLDLLHTGHCRGMTTDMATGLSCAAARLAASATAARLRLRPTPTEPSSLRRPLHGGQTRVARAVLYPSESIASATSPAAASGIAVAASSRRSSRAPGISREIASPLPTGKNGSRRPWTTSVGTSISGRRSRQRGLQLSLATTMPSWLAIWVGGAVPGVRSQMRAAIARAATGSSPKISARAAANSATASRSVQSGIGRVNRRSIVALSWSGRSASGLPGATARVPARVSAENAPGWSSAATWATIPPTPIPARCAGLPSSVSTRAAASAARSRRVYVGASGSAVVDSPLSRRS